MLELLASLPHMKIFTVQDTLTQRFQSSPSFCWTDISNFRKRTTGHFKSLSKENQITYSKLFSRRQDFVREILITP